MAQIYCNVKNCEHNNDGGCVLDSLKVEGTYATTPDSTMCESFSHAQKGFSFTNSKNDSFFPKDNTHIECYAYECIYNENNICTSNTVEISGRYAKTDEETNCETFSYAD